MISITLITLLTLFSPLISMDKANAELRKEIREKKIIEVQLRRAYEIEMFMIELERSDAPWHRSET